MIVGKISSNDALSMSGIPDISYITGLYQILGNHSGSKENDEPLIIVTPHVTAMRQAITDTIWVTDSPGLRLR